MPLPPRNRPTIRGEDSAPVQLVKMSHGVKSSSSSLFSSEVAKAAAAPAPAIRKSVAGPPAAGAPPVSPGGGVQAKKVVSPKRTNPNSGSNLRSSKNLKSAAASSKLLPEAQKFTEENVAQVPVNPHTKRAADGTETNPKWREHSTHAWEHRVVSRSSLGPTDSEDKESVAFVRAGLGRSNAKGGPVQRDPIDVVPPAKVARKTGKRMRIVPKAKATNTTAEKTDKQNHVPPAPGDFNPPPRAAGEASQPSRVTPTPPRGAGTKRKSVANPNIIYYDEALMADMGFK